MVGIFSKVIRARRAETVKQERTDILQVFMDMRYKDGSVLTEDQIVGLLIALLFAGQHTSSITSTWTVLFLLHNPECMRKVMEEQRRVNPGGAPLTFELVGEMGYLQNCVKESLRMYPPLIMLMRKAMRDVECDDKGRKFIIPEGDIVVTSPAVTGMMESVHGPDAKQFNPDRFETMAQKPKYSFVGFGGGRHACMGQQFGLLQVVTLVSVLLRSYKFETIGDKFPDPDYTAMVVGPKDNTRVRYSKIA
jgi:sterol 14-demethylase